MSRLTKSIARMATELVIPRPDDWHLHLRDGAGLATLMKGPSSSLHFMRRYSDPVF